MGEVTRAQYCRNGHQITSDVDRHAEAAANFCPQCGAATVSVCEHCAAPIRGLQIGGYGTVVSIPRGNHCYNCGKEYPWVAEKLVAARDLIELMDELTADEKAQLTRSIEDIVQGGPRTEVGVFSFKRTLTKVRQGSQEFLYKLAVDIASEAAKKALTGS